MPAPEQTHPIFAFPSKGRLREQALAFFRTHGLEMVEDNGRGLRARLPGLDLDVLMLPAAEIVVQLRRGSVQLGLTGDDLIRERMADWENVVERLRPLPFGQARIVIAVPNSWIDVETLDDFDDAALHFQRRHGRRLRIATKYPRLTREFFSRHGLIDYRLVESLGSTEAAPANQAAEAIVDIVSTGKTLRDNNLKPLQDETGLDLAILESRAALYLPRPWQLTRGGGYNTRLLPERAVIGDRLLEPARDEAGKLAALLGLRQ